MRRIFIPLLILMLCGSGLLAEDETFRKYRSDPGINCNLNHYSLDLYGTSIIVRDNCDRHKIVITEGYELIIDGKVIETNEKQRELLKEYYQSAQELIEDAMFIGIKGAEVGLKGARIGAFAVCNVFKVLLPGYDIDDLEWEIEKLEAGIEKEARSLEREARVIERRAEKLERLFSKLEREIPELKEID